MQTVAPGSTSMHTGITNTSVQVLRLNKIRGAFGFSPIWRFQGALRTVPKFRAHFAKRSKFYWYKMTCKTGTK